MTLIGKTLFAGIPRRKGRLSQRALHQNDIQSSYLATLKRVTSLISNTQFLISVNHRFDKKGIFGKVKSPKPTQTKEAQTNDTAIRAKS